MSNIFILIVFLLQNAIYRKEVLSIMYFTLDRKEWDTENDNKQ